MKVLLHFFRLLSLIIIFITFSNQLICQTTELTFRFNSPEIDAELSELCFDVEAQADMGNSYLEELKIKIFIDNSRINFKEFRDAAAGYNLETGGTTIETQAGSGPGFFGFEGEAIYALDNFKSNNQVISQDKLITQSPDWTYLYKVCFTAANPSDFYATTGQICPPVVWHHGFNPWDNDDDMQATLLNPNGGPNLAVVEDPINANWDSFAPNTDLGPCADALVSINENHLDEDVEIMITPNPVKDMLSIQSLQNSWNLSNWEIYNAEGKSVLKLQKDTNSFNSSLAQSIDVSSLSQGVYFIKFSNKGDFQTKRFVKQ